MSRTRLSKEELKTIFGCIENNEPPPPELSFRVIQLPLNNSKISPPPFEYDDGVYVLLKSDSRNQRLSQVPTTLANSLLTEQDLNRLDVCHWRSSGMKSHRSNLPSAKYLLRYCYPQSENYKNNKGCTIWTQRADNGVEDLRVRIVHIYPANTKRSCEPFNQPPAKKQSTQPKNDTLASEDAVYADLMAGALIKTPPLEESSSNVPNIPIDSLFDCLEDDSDDDASTRKPMPSSNLARVSLSPRADLQSFAGKVHALAKDVYLSKKQDQVRMIQMIQKQLDVLNIAVESDATDTDSDQAEISAKVKIEPVD